MTFSLLLLLLLRLINYRRLHPATVTSLTSVAVGSPWKRRHRSPETAKCPRDLCIIVPCRVSLD